MFQTQQKLQEQALQQLNEQLQVNVMQQGQLLQQQAAAGGTSSAKVGDMKQVSAQLQQLKLQQQQIMQQIQLQQRQFFLSQGLLGLPQFPPHSECQSSPPCRVGYISRSGPYPRQYVSCSCFYFQFISPLRKISHIPSFMSFCHYYHLLFPLLSDNLTSLVPSVPLTLSISPCPSHPVHLTLSISPRPSHPVHLTPSISPCPSHPVHLTLFNYVCFHLFSLNTRN